LDPLEDTLTLPLAPPAVLGANATVNDVLWPALNVMGSDRPLMLKPAAVTVAAEIVTLVPPLLVNVTV